MILSFQVNIYRYIPELYNLAHPAAWESNDLLDLEQVSWVGPVLYRSCTAPHDGM